MSRLWPRSPQVGRALRALLIVGVLVAVVPVSGCIADLLQGHSQEAEPLVALSAGSEASPSDAEAALDAVGRQLDSYEVGAAPLDVPLPEGARDLMSSAGGDVLGCMVDGLEEQQVMEMMQHRMEQAGWQCVPLGGVSGATFVKADGALPWYVVTATESGDSVSVVYRRVGI